MIGAEFPILIGVISVIIFLIIGYFQKYKSRNIFIGCLFIAYITAVISITLFPILIDEKVIYYGETKWYNFMPFETIGDILRNASIFSIISNGFNSIFLTQFIGNIIMAVPFGVFVMLFLRKVKWWKLLLLALLFTVSIEFLQFTIGIVIDNMYRTVDIDDVILNTVGTYCGYGVYMLTGKIMNKS